VARLSDEGITRLTSKYWLGFVSSGGSGEEPSKLTQLADKIQFLWSRTEVSLSCWILAKRLLSAPMAVLSSLPHGSLHPQSQQ